MSTTRPNDSSVPLCVDMDGTLIRTDVLWESLALLLRRNPFYALALPFWLLRGRAFLKQQLAARTNLNPATLPYHQEFLEFLRAERRHDRPLILVTAADRAPAERVAAHVGLFSEVIASDGQMNVRGKRKAAVLVGRFGKQGFDYAGNSIVDVPVWREAREAIVVNANDALARKAAQVTKVGQVFGGHEFSAAALFRALRPHQWVKNVILFVPLLTAHKLGELDKVKSAVLAFTAFCFCASAVYIFNDLMDLAADRSHETKKFRPLASGAVPLSIGFSLAPVLLLFGAGAVCFLPWNFAWVLLGYLVLTTGYSAGLKQFAPLDVFLLATLYTLRLIGGHEATGLPYSFWLLAFSMFIFLSLALVKRFTELRAMRRDNRQIAPGRGYTAGDLEVVAMLGVTGGFLAVLVMVLYVNSPEVQALYAHPIILLLICPLLLFWISRVWLLAHRGQMHDDPIVFALKDRVSYLIGALTLAVLWAATGH